MVLRGGGGGGGVYLECVRNLFPFHYISAMIRTVCMTGDDVYDSIETHALVPLLPSQANLEKDAQSTNVRSFMC